MSVLLFNLVYLFVSCYINLFKKLFVNCYISLFIVVWQLVIVYESLMNQPTVTHPNAVTIN